MTALEFILYAALFIVGILAHIAVYAAYQNGVTDGYGYAREPRNPGYKQAGEYLRKYMAHRWSELRIQPPGVWKGHVAPDLPPVSKDAP